MGVMDEADADIAAYALLKVIDWAGGRSRLARALGLHRQTVCTWAQMRRPRVSAPHVLELERLSGVPRYELRPDLYPRPLRPSPVRLKPPFVETAVRPRRGRALTS
jgi:DNA-binding transcriptional regulator YdaS (Cro superfamily)